MRELINYGLLLLECIGYIGLTASFYLGVIAIGKLFGMIIDKYLY